MRNAAILGPLLGHLVRMGALSGLAALVAGPWLACVPAGQRWHELANV